MSNLDPSVSLCFPVFSDPLQTQKAGGHASYDIHYWIGSGSSQDEQGAAAVYTTQLDDFLGSGPVQHREVQNHESEAFRGYFKQGIMWVEALSESSRNLELRVLL